MNFHRLCLGATQMIIDFVRTFGRHQLFQSDWKRFVSSMICSTKRNSCSSIHLHSLWILVYAEPCSGTLHRQTSTSWCCTDFQEPLGVDMHCCWNAMAFDILLRWKPFFVVDSVPAPTVVPLPICLSPACFLRKVYCPQTLGSSDSALFETIQEFFLSKLHLTIKRSSPPFFGR